MALSCRKKELPLSNVRPLSVRYSDLGRAWEAESGLGLGFCGCGEERRRNGEEDSVLAERSIMAGDMVRVLQIFAGFYRSCWCIA